jgi:hypothetical protein
MGDREREPKLFTLTEAERTRVRVEPLLLDAIECRRRMAEPEKKLEGLSRRIHLMGGLAVDYEKVVKFRRERDRLAQQIKAALEQIESTGCVVKDLDMGLIDFPSRFNGEEVFLCWRVGEDRIRFWHRQDEGFAGRKPIDPNDPGNPPPVQ